MAKYSNQYRALYSVRNGRNRARFEANVLRSEANKIRAAVTLYSSGAANNA
jgi:hypothetical protein